MKKILRIISCLLLTAILLPVCLVALYRYIPVPVTPLMLTRNIDEGTPINYTWTPIEKISPNLVQAVVASEDNLFMEHDGFDFKQIEIARREAEAGKRLRGASTITQQTAKNLFLWQGRSWLRKGLEAYFTVLMEQLWSKKRIMEAYLNCIEMGDGIYGAAAVAKINFNTTPDKLTKEQCALIAATLPNPRKFNSAKPSKYMKQRQNAILKNMKNIGPVKFE
ncbi:MAG: monofunctional biosynthetic peptidoglycan transglycosylase [Bacteroidaceae bacterium]|nr:monofunctional biosynthetic peptidoglycan transglycosylase [Bacteroidaceae bacterium]MBQ5816725.1 monofunctional biosynthetic peptidoglycan transglycosylase [Bacteroidaceae bacterium]